MDKYIYDDKNGLWYELQGDYYIPCLILPAEKEQPIGLWGQRHLRYLKEYRRATYITLFTSGRLNNYLADIDRQAQERMERLTEQMKRVQGITEQLKAENALEWTQRMNNIRACAKEIVEKEIIFLHKKTAVGFSFPTAVSLKSKKNILTFFYVLHIITHRHLSIGGD